MKIQTIQRQSVARYQNPRRRLISLASIAVASGLLVAAFGAGLFFANSDAKERVDKLLALDPAEVAMNYVSSWGAKPPRLTIDIKHEYHLQLAEWRKLALQRNQITADLKSYVPAKIRFEDQILKADVRLKGEWVDHVETDKWSLRVKVKKNRTLLGMKRFSLQHPKTRSYHNEPFYQQTLRREGIVSLRYQFVEVVINGRNHGIYALEEHFGKQLVENNQRREGPILRFDAALRYKPFSLDFGSRSVKVPGILRDTVKQSSGTQAAAELVAYDADKLVSDASLGQQLDVAINLLQALRDGRLPTHKVFDTTKLANYFAISELTGALWTADDWSDMRFVYNPVTSRLEPIAVEGYSYDRIKTLLGFKYTSGESPESHFHTILFSDPEFFRKYVSALDRVSEPEYLDNLVDDLLPQLKPQFKILNREFPYARLTLDVFRSNASAIRHLLSPDRAVRAYLEHQDDGTCEIEVAAIQPFPVEIVKATTDGAEFHPDTPTILPGMRPLQRAEFQRIRLTATPKPDWPNGMPPTLNLWYRLLGTNQARQVDVTLRPRFRPQAIESVTRSQPNAGEFPFLSIDEHSRTIAVQPGKWTIDRNVILPPGYQVVAKAGLTLDLKDSASILSYSPIRFEGDVEEPITITSSNGSGGGLVVMSAPAESLLKHVIVRQLGEPVESGWAITGAVTFYEAPVRFEACEFVDCRSEDSLNVIRSTFQIDRSHFRGSPSDSLDVDFATGSVMRTTFTDVRGDALDFSGSTIELRSIKAERVADKGVSIGEATTLTGRDIDIRHSNIGIAAKDLSSATLTNTNLVSCEIGLALFQKKSEYGPSQLSAHTLQMTGVRTPYLVEIGSTLFVDDTPITADGEHVADQLYASDE